MWNKERTTQAPAKTRCFFIRPSSFSPAAVASQIVCRRVRSGVREWRRRRKTAKEQVRKHVNRVRELEPTVVIPVRGVEARWCPGAEEQVPEHVDGVRELDFPVAIRVASKEPRLGPRAEDDQEDAIVRRRDVLYEDDVVEPVTVPVACAGDLEARLKTDDLHPVPRELGKIHGPRRPAEDDGRRPPRPGGPA